MLADFSNHKVGMMIGDTEITLIVKDGKASIEPKVSLLTVT